MLQIPRVFPRVSYLGSAKAVQCPRPGPKIGNKSQQIPRYSPVCPRGQPPGMAADKCIKSKATSVPQTPQTNHSQYSSPVEALNLIVDSKSQPVELDNSTIQLHVPSRRKKRLQSYCSVDFDFLAFIGI